jgi:hypothetical protein
MDQIRDQAGAGTCAKGTLLGLTRTGGLLMAAVLASILLIDLPIPAGRVAEAPPYVPAADSWIELGATSGADPAPLSKGV